MNNKAILGALAMDLKRVALGYYRGSNATAHRFFQEAIKRREEIDKKSIKPYLRRILDNLDKISSPKNTKDAAEDALMYSTLLQNAAIT